MAATNQQVQDFIDSRVRQSCSDILLWILRRQNDAANLDDVYANLSSSPTWTDARTAGVAHSAVPQDFFAWNTFIQGLLKVVVSGQPLDGRTAAETISDIHAQWATIQKLPITPIPQ